MQPGPKQFGQLENSEVIDSFELNGQPANILRLSPEDLAQIDFSEHARNLADSNFELLDEVPHAAKREQVRSLIYRARERLKRLPHIGDKIGNSERISALLQRVYPDYSYEEHFRAYRDRSYQKYIDKNQLLGIEIDGQIVAVQAYEAVGQTPEGRAVFEFTKASTIDSHKGKGLNPKLKQSIFQLVMEENPNAIWVSASVNQAHIEKFLSRGWHLTEVDDPNPAIQAMFTRNPGYQHTMKAQGYKALYCDPKVDNITWN